MHATNIIRNIIGVLLANRAALVAENLALRQQLAVLSRSAKRPRLRQRDRIFWVWISKFWRGWRSALVVVQPDTVVRWHHTRQATSLTFSTKSSRGPSGSRSNRRPVVTGRTKHAAIVGPRVKPVLGTQCAHQADRKTPDDRPGLVNQGGIAVSSPRKSLVAVCSLALCGILFPSTVLGYDIQIDVAPNVLNIQSESVVVTVHTDVAYSLVAGSTVFLNGVAISHWKADARGNFVAKFSSDEIKALDGLKIDDYNTLVLTGYTTNGDAFMGTQEIKVISVISQKKN